MKQYAFIIFFLIFSAIYFLGSYYVFSRGNQALPQGIIKTIFPWVFWIISASFVVGQFLERGAFNPGTQMVTFIGSIGLALLWYLLLQVVIIDLVRLANNLFHFIPENWIQSFLQPKYLFMTVATVALSLVIGGHINALNPRIKEVNIQIDKQAGIQESYKVALVTDIHMGFIIGNNRVERLAKKLNQLDLDFVLLGGDQVDHNPDPVIKKDMGKHFKTINSKHGVFAVTGNHEYIGSPEASLGYLSQNGITYLRDTLTEIDGLVIAGRDDKTKSQFAGTARKNVNHVLEGADKNKPIILIDHQPVEYSQVKDAGVDLMVSGHTHKGQFWPFNYITKRVFENDYGLLIKGETHYYTSSGYGTWGPPVRVGNRPEIVVFNITLKN